MRTQGDENLNNQKTVTLLRNKDVTGDLVQFKGKIKIRKRAIIIGLLLLDFPLGKYELQIDGNSVVANPEDDIEMKDDDGNVLGYNFTKTKDGFIDLSKCRIVNLLIPKGVNLNKKHKLEFHHKKLSPRGENSKFYYDVYPYDTYHISMSGPTESLLVEVRTDDKNLLDKYYYYGYEEIILRFDGEDYGKYPVNDGRCLLDFRDERGKYRDKQNLYLNAEQNNNSVNFCALSTCEIITVNCELLKVYQNVYVTYSYPLMIPLF